MTTRKITVRLSHDDLTDILEVMNAARQAAADVGAEGLAARRRRIVNLLAAAEESHLRAVG